MLSAAGGGAADPELLSAATTARLGLVFRWVPSAAGGGAADPELLSAAAAARLGLIIRWVLSDAATTAFGLDCHVFALTGIEPRSVE